MHKDKNLIRKAWESFLESINHNISAESEKIERAIGFSRLGEQLWNALDESENGWAYPLDIFLGDDGSSLFTIVAQGGKLYQIPMNVAQDTLSLGEWIQVTEVFQPVTQSRFSVKRQKDGIYRWLCIAGTTVLNRVGQMDSSQLFDSFVQQAEKKGKYPRLDFYHLGEMDPKVWEFGTADYLAREGVCYIASGTFDVGHPLAEAMIRSCESGCDEWGNSIEFYAYSEPEILVLDPKIQVPVYKEGENTRISVVLEKDAAGLFTRMIEVSEEINRTMDPRVEEALKKIFGDDEDAVAAFIENVDTVNRTVKNDKLIHRKKKDELVAEIPEDDEDPEDVADEKSDEDDTEEETTVLSVELDDEGLKVIAKQLMDAGAFGVITQSIDALTHEVTSLKTAREADTQEITRLKKANSQLVKKVEALSVDDVQKKEVYLQDLPRRKPLLATYRKRDEEDSEEDDDLEQVAQKTLSTLPSY